MSFTNIAAFDQVLTLVQAGRRQEAYVQVKALAKMDPTNTNLLLWLAFTTPDLHQAELAINKVAFLDPHHPSIPGAREWLAGERRKQQTQTLTMVVAIPPAEQIPSATIENVPLPAQPASRSVVANEAAWMVEPKKAVSRPAATKRTAPLSKLVEAELAEATTQPVMVL